MELRSTTPLRAVAIGVLGIGIVGCGGRDAHWPAGATRTVRTTLSRGEGVAVGTDVVMAGMPIGEVREADTTGAEGGVRLVLAIDHPRAPLRAGLRAEVRPTGVLSPDVVALLPGPADAPPLPEGAVIPGFPRAATEAERRTAMRVVLPAIGLPALGALVPAPESSSPGAPSDSAARRQPGHP